MPNIVPYQFEIKVYSLYIFPDALNSGRQSVHCLLSNSDSLSLSTMLDNLENAANQRLGITDKIIQNIKLENELAKNLGYQDFSK